MDIMTKLQIISPIIKEFINYNPVLIDSLSTQLERLNQPRLIGSGNFRVLTHSHPNNMIPHYHVFIKLDHIYKELIFKKNTTSIHHVSDPTVYFNCLLKHPSVVLDGTLNHLSHFCEEELPI